MALRVACQWRNKSCKDGFEYLAGIYSTRVDGRLPTREAFGVPVPRAHKCDFSTFEPEVGKRAERRMGLQLPRKLGELTKEGGVRLRRRHHWQLLLQLRVKVMRALGFGVRNYGGRKTEL